MSRTDVRLRAPQSFALMLALGLAGTGIGTAQGFAPRVTLAGLPTEVLIGEPFQFRVIVAPDPVANGYGPFVEIYLDLAGADCTGLPNRPDRCDGLHFVSAAAQFAVTRMPLSPCPSAADLPFAFPVGPACSPPNPAQCLGTTSTRPLPSVCFFGADPPVCPGESTAGTQKIVLELPFGSFVPGQPPVEVEVTALVDSYADEGTPLRIQARGGFRYADDPKGGKPASLDRTCPMAAATTTARLLRLRKEYLGPEKETATGPNFPRPYKITVDVANGQRVDDLRVVDCLPQGLAFLNASAPGGAPFFDAGSNCLTVDYPPITGGPGDSDAAFTFDFFVAEKSSGQPVLNGTCRTPLTDHAEASGHWIPQDPRDPPPVDVSGQADDTLTAKCLALQKSQAIVAEWPGGGAGFTPGDIVEYTLSFQVSDFLTAHNLTLDDYLSDGQSLLPGSATLTIGDKLGTVSAPFDPGTLLSVPLRGRYTCADGSSMLRPTRLRFLISGLLAKLDPLTSRHNAGILTGGRAGLPPGPGATGTIRFRARINDSFQRQLASREPFVDKDDPMLDCAVVNAGYVANADLPAVPSAPAGASSDDSLAKFTIAHDLLRKSVYAVNGNPNIAHPPRIAPGDRVTFRIRYPLPSTDAEKLSFDDFLPLPVFHVAGSFPLSNSCAVPPTFPTNTAQAVGPLCTYLLSAGPLPTLIPFPASNSLHFDYGTLQDPANQRRAVDLLFTVTASADPFVDGLHLTNHVREQESNTFGAVSSETEVAEVVLGEPKLRIRKGVVATSRESLSPELPMAVYAPSPPAPAGVLFAPPGTLGTVAAFNGVINSSNIKNTLGSDVSNIDGGDLVRFVIVIENLGTSSKGAFDVQLADVLPPCVGNPSAFSRFNLRVVNGRGIPFTCNGGKDCADVIPGTDIPLLFGPGITLDDKLGAGALGPYGPTRGDNLAIVTFDARVNSTAAAAGCCSNTATIGHYAGVERGPDHTKAGFSIPFPGASSPFADAARVCVQPKLKKEIVATSEAATPGHQLTIGEIVRYRLTAVVPEGSLPGLTLEDQLPFGLIWLQDTCTLQTDPELRLRCKKPRLPLFLPNPPFTFTSTDNLRVNFGNVVNNCASSPADETIVVECDALVLNARMLGPVSLPINSRGEEKRNSFTLKVGGTSYPSNETTSVIAEPAGGLSKQEVPSFPPSPSTVGYLLTYTNSGSSPAFDVRILDPLPAPLALVPGSIVVSAPCVSSGAQSNVVSVTCTEIPPNGTVMVLFTATGVPTCQEVTNNARLTYSSLPGSRGTIFNPTQASTPGTTGAPNGEREYRTGTSAVTLRCADLTIQKTHEDSLSTVGLGSYIITVANLGNVPSVPPETVSDTLPAGFEFSSAGGNGWTCSMAGRTVTCTNPAPIPAGGSSSFKVTGGINAPHPEGITNCATVTTPSELNLANNQACDTVITCTPPPDGLLYWYPLDEPEPEQYVTFEFSGSNLGLHIPQSGPDAPTPTPGKVDYGLCFNGSGSYVDVFTNPGDFGKNDPGSGDLTIDAWVKTTAQSGVQPILDKRQGTPDLRGYRLFLSNGLLAFELANGPGSPSCSTSPSSACTDWVAPLGFVADGQWNLVAVTVKRNQPGGGTFYVNGTAVGTFDPTGRQGALTNNGNLWLAATHPINGPFSTLNGCLDEVEIFNRALSAAEIQTLYKVGSLGKCKFRDN